MRNDFAHRTSNRAYITYLESHRRAEVPAGVRVRFTLGTNKCGTVTDSPETEQQKGCEKAIAERFRALHLQQGLQNVRSTGKSNTVNGSSGNRVDGGRGNSVDGGNRVSGGSGSISNESGICASNQTPMAGTGGSSNSQLGTSCGRQRKVKQRASHCITSNSASN